MDPYDHYDLEAVNDQLERCRELGFHRDRTGSVDSWEEFWDLPFMGTEDIFGDIEESPPYGTMYRDDTALTALTPAGEDDLMLEYSTSRDLQALGETIGDIFQEIGIEDGDVVVSCFSYTPFAGGYAFHVGLEMAGANIVPMGPGESQRTADFIEKYDVDVLLSPASFAMEIASKGGTDVDTVVCSGEPFTVVPGYRDQMKEAFGDVTTVDYYGLSEVGPVASEDGSENGMYVADQHVLLEVVDPETGEALGPGERGEAVVTHLFKEAQPLVRYRTGDLTELAVEDGQLVLPRGIFGRTDDMVKVKGVKTYPGQLGLVFHGTPGLTGNYRVIIDRPDNTDRFTIECECEDLDAVDREALADTIEEKLLLAPDELRLATDLDAEGMDLDDRRF